MQQAESVLAIMKSSNEFSTEQIYWQSASIDHRVDLPFFRKSRSSVVVRKIVSG